MLKTFSFAFELNKEDYAVINGKKVFLYIADTPEEHLQGLMGVKSLPENFGMIFLFDKAEPRAFWMKNMEIPIDMIFLKNKKIVNIHKNISIDAVEKHTLYNSIYKSDVVIEVNAGFCDKYDVKMGNFIYLSPDLKSKIIKFN
ncbi:MAG TPA: DUF192 domain-containing protein [Candidatus Gastranaerophilales bacterium]|nr:DUF192 domain-containing protein [Candidatus Gastranaerophilales bacterium]